MSAKILVIDDNPTNLKLVSELLEFEGHKILKAADAEEARLVLADTLTELILMDIALPGMDGLTLTRPGSCTLSTFRVFPVFRKFKLLLRACFRISN